MINSILNSIPAETVLSGLAIRGVTAQSNTASAKSIVEEWITEDLKDVFVQPMLLQQMPEFAKRCLVVDHSQLKALDVQ